MLSIRMRAGDDVYFGPRGDELHTYKQAILRSVKDDVATVFTPDEIIDVPLSDARDEDFVSLNIHGVEVAVTDYGHIIPGTFTFSVKAPRETTILRGRAYRKALQETD